MSSAPAVPRPSPRSEPFVVLKRWLRRIHRNACGAKLAKIERGEWQPSWKYRANPQPVVWVTDSHLPDEQCAVVSLLEKPLFDKMRELCEHPDRFRGKTEARGVKLQNHAMLVTASHAQLAALLGWRVNRVSRVIARLRAKHVVRLWDVTADKEAPGPRSREETGARKNLPSRYLLPAFADVLNDLRRDPRVASLDRGDTRYPFMRGFSHKLMTPEEAADWNLEAIVPDRYPAPEAEVAPRVPEAATPATPEPPEPEPSPEPDEACERAWNAIAPELAYLVGDTFATWFGGAEVIAVNGKHVTLGVPLNSLRIIAEQGFGNEMMRAARECGYSEIDVRVCPRLKAGYLATDAFWRRQKPPPPPDAPPSEALLDTLAKFTGSRDQYLASTVVEIRKVAHQRGSWVSDDEMILLWRWACVERNGGRQQRAAWFQSVVINRIGSWIKEQARERDKQERYDIEYARGMVEYGDPVEMAALLKQHAPRIWFYVADDFKDTS